MRVLLIDDSPDATLVLGRLLSRRGFEVRVAHSARDGVDLAGHFVPDAVLLDISLPDMDGYEAAGRLRDAFSKPPKVIAYSGSEPDLALCRQVGISAFLSKPSSVDEVVAAIHADSAAESSGESRSQV